jgi:uncharacterized protein (TIGR02466 family)
MNHSLNLVFPTPVFSSNIFDVCDNAQQIFDETFSEMKKEVLSSESIVAQSESSMLHKQERYSKIIEYFNLVLEEIKTINNYDTEKFEISQMWINKSTKGISHPTHYHPNSYFSGVMYFSEGSQINFKDPVYSRLNSQLIVGNSLDTHNFATNPKEGLLLIFPSWLYHGTEINHTDSRWSMSFNCLPSGKTNYNIDTLRYSKVNLTIN